MVFAVVPVLVAGLVLRTERAVRSGSASRSARSPAASAYCALFALLSVLTRHAVVVGLIYLLIWESLLGGLLDGVRWLSVSRWSARDRRAGRRRVPRRRPGAGYAVVATALVIVLGVWLTGRRLRAFNLTGDE